MTNPIITFRMREDLHREWVKHPKYRNRSKILNKLVEMYLKGLVNVNLPKKA